MYIERFQCVMSWIARLLVLQACVLLLRPGGAAGSTRFDTDIINTSEGQVQIFFLGHASLGMDFHDRHIYVDPWAEEADFSKMPNADVILITEDKSDHFDLRAIKELSNDNTLVVMPKICAVKYGEGMIMNNGDTETVRGFKIEAFPAYNIVDKNSAGFPYHLKGIGNGYVITFGDKRIYIAGDTEEIPEMNKLGKIDIAFLPVGPPDAMTVEMAVDAVRLIKPRIFYPYRYGDTDISRLKELVEDQSETEVRIRNMK